MKNLLKYVVMMSYNYSGGGGGGIGGSSSGSGGGMSLFIGGAAEYRPGACGGGYM